MGYFLLYKAVTSYMACGTESAGATSVSIRGAHLTLNIIIYFATRYMLM